MKTQQYDSAMNAVAFEFERRLEEWEEGVKDALKDEKGNPLKNDAQIAKHFLKMIVKMDEWWPELMDARTYNSITTRLENTAEGEYEDDDEKGLPSKVKEDLEVLENAAQVFEATMEWLVNLKPLLDTLRSNKKDKGEKLVEILSQGAPEI
jgi:hypothetical protein